MSDAIKDLQADQGDQEDPEDQRNHRYPVRQTDERALKTQRRIEEIVMKDLVLRD